MEFIVVKVANGWVVRESTGISRGDYVSMQDSYVFNTWAACAKWMEEQFKTEGKRK